MEIWTLNEDTSMMLGETAKVITAVADAPGLSRVPSTFHVMLIGPLAFAGTQLPVVMDKDNEQPVPVFLM